MANMLQTGLEWLNTTMKASVGTSITITRVNTAITVTATLGSQLLRVFDSRGNTKIIRPQLDVMVDAEDYDFGDGVVQPVAGDVVGVTYGDVVKQFRVSPPSPGEPAWHYCDPHRVRLRLHTEFVGNA